MSLFFTITPSFLPCIYLSLSFLRERERDRDRDRDRETDTERDRDGESNRERDGDRQKDSQAELCLSLGICKDMQQDKSYRQHLAGVQCYSLHMHETRKSK